MTAFPSYEFFFAVATYVAILSFLRFARIEPPLLGRSSLPARLRALGFGVGSAIAVGAGAWGLARLQNLESGVAFYGGLIGFLFFALAFARSTHIDLVELLNRTSPGLALAHAVGRIGCFLEGCCYGTHCDLPWGVSREGAPGLVHPVQIYESLALAGLGLFLWKNERLRLEGHARPSSAGVYFGTYAVIRFGLEFLRGDMSRGIWAGLSTSQWISIPFFVLGITLLRARRRRNLSS